MKKHYIYLMYTGALPFIFCALSLAVGIEVIPVFGKLETILSVYGLVITSFMAGSHWGQHLGLNEKWQQYLPAISNIGAIVLWISFLVFPFKVLLFTYAICFLVFLLIDKMLFADGLISNEYFRTRCLVTLLVLATLITAGAYA